jgi:hypothetical protein
MQSYGSGPLFTRLRDEADAIFMGMPPPKPSISSRTGAPVARMSQASFSNQYYNSNNSCFRGDSQVKLADGTIKDVQDVRKGDVISNGEGGKTSTINCVVKTIAKGGKCDLVQLPGGLALTPYHPIKIDDKWVFPKDVKVVDYNVDCEAVYSFVLDANHTMLINGVVCVTLGHGILNDAVVSHPYFGSQKVVDDLKSFESGWRAGIVVFNYGSMKRVQVNNTETLIVGFNKERYMENLSAVY